MRSLVVAVLALSACAPSVGVAVGPDHPAAATPAPEGPVRTVALAPVTPPALPGPLRPDLTVAGRPTAMGPGAMGSPSSPLALSLDAYLAVQEALAADGIDGVAGQARAFAAAFGALTASAPDHDPHRWHARATDVAAARTAAADLARATALADAREAFARLSAAYLRLVDATGVPDGYDLRPMTCGMVAGAPEGGVWLQRTGPTRNPYYGSAMLTCGSEQPAAPDADGPSGHDGH